MRHRPVAQSGIADQYYRGSFPVAICGTHARSRSAGDAPGNARGLGGGGLCALWQWIQKRNATHAVAMARAGAALYRPVFRKGRARNAMRTKLPREARAGIAARCARVLAGSRSFQIPPRPVTPRVLAQRGLVPPPGSELGLFPHAVGVGAEDARQIRTLERRDPRLDAWNGSP